MAEFDPASANCRRIFQIKHLSEKNIEKSSFESQSGTITVLEVSQNGGSQRAHPQSILGHNADYEVLRRRLDCQASVMGCQAE
jgi:hypothetical protein